MSDGLLHRIEPSGEALLENFKTQSSKLIKNIRFDRWLYHMIVKLAASKVNYIF